MGVCACCGFTTTCVTLTGICYQCFHVPLPSPAHESAELCLQGIQTPYVHLWCFSRLCRVMYVHTYNISAIHSGV